ncbi:SH3-domain-containing protein [Pleomassaria siparia CBS 279.74]|uniref:SH3-domain-containing protein n=1 Tax=Pleomassaria siparia CBS 279.74 TaxID=1314801 RepID=A0A6G1JZU9_9PLEO|nr:SH3-domain-containing protein [Pleomassaria siparia CBS 279.74]
MSDGLTKAMTNRSLRAIKTELEFLVDASIITQDQYDTIIGQLPLSAAARAPQPAALATPTTQMANLNVNPETHNEKANNVGYYSNNNASNPPPPAYATPPVAPVVPALAYASALYQYNAQDAGDLALAPNDKIIVTEYMNSEWWKGKNERTGQEGIFPSSYVRKEERSFQPTPSPAPQQSNYGNMPVDVSNGAASNTPAKMPGGEAGKKFGKKLGNAAVFGAGATIGSKIVNGIF